MGNRAVFQASTWMVWWVYGRSRKQLSYQTQGHLRLHPDGHPVVVVPHRATPPQAS